MFVRGLLQFFFESKTARGLEQTKVLVTLGSLQDGVRLTKINTYAQSTDDKC